MNAFAALIRRDLRVAWRHGAEMATAVAFFVLCALLFPFGLSPDTLPRAAPGILWVAALLAALLALDRLFAADAEDGSLDLFLLSPLPPERIVLAKAIAHWLTAGLPLIVAAPPLAGMLGLDTRSLPALLLALTLGTPVLSLLGTVGAALAVGARRGGVLTALLILPLDIPVLIFGAAAVDARLAGLPVTPHLLLLAALLIAALVLAPVAGAAALRAAAE